LALEQGEEDLKRTGIAAVAAAGVVLALQGEFLHEHWQSAMWATFALGYINIIFEEVTGGESIPLGSMPLAKRFVDRVPLYLLGLKRCLSSTRQPLAF